jgi:hypothetical protein
MERKKKIFSELDGTGGEMKAGFFHLGGRVESARRRLEGI